MIPKKIRWLVFVIIVVVSTAGCFCDAADVQALMISADSPAGGEVVSSLNPTFTLSHNQSCNPEKYRLRIKENIIGVDFEWNDYVLPADLPFTLNDVTLLPGRQYQWEVQGVKEYESAESPSAQSQFSEPAFFFTGPICSGETLQAPTLNFPQDGYGGEYNNWITHDGPHEFHWNYGGGCLPVSYDYQFATDNGFSNIVLNGTTTEPYVQSIHETFPNCSTLFWRVRANDGSSVGPWSDFLSFHWVMDDSCDQIKFISDDAARIRVHLYEDDCGQTGYRVPTRVKVDSGCMVDSQGQVVVGDGLYENPPDHLIWGFKADLGSGPCPSTGLDSMTFGGLWNYEYLFHVLAPGTYCVSISRDQVVDNNGTDISLMKGIWTEPRNNDIVAMKTIEFESGLHEVDVYFGWDHFDKVYLPFPLDKTLNCRFVPYTGCPIAAFAMKGEMIPIYARDTDTEWKLTALNGTPCYIYLESALIDQYLVEIDEGGYRVDDLEFFAQPPPCTPDPSPVGRRCAGYKAEPACIAAGCNWNFTTDSCTK